MSRENSANPKLTPQILAHLAALEKLGDADIDLSDMPEVLDWSNAVQGKFYRPVKQQVTLRLDADVVHWFKTQATGGRGYQSRINAALRQLVEEAERKAG